MKPFLLFRLLGLYGLYFLLACKLIRSSTSHVENMWLSEMPNVDRLWVICHEVYICREMQMFTMEELLFSKLLFIMRSREICIRISRDLENTSYNPNFVVNTNNFYN